MEIGEANSIGSFRTGALRALGSRGNNSGAGSSSIWRSNSSGLADVFSRSSRSQEDGLEDEEALQWAAIQRLPTYKRIRKDILSIAEGEIKEADIDNLGITERRVLLDRLVKVAEEDHEKFLLELKNRLDQAQIEIPTIEVRFEHVNIGAEAHVGCRALPTIFNSVANVLEGILGCLHIVPSKKVPVAILHDVSGIIKPCRMTLLLGPPASGKTSLMLALAGQLDKDLKFSNGSEH